MKRGRRQFELNSISCHMEVPIWFTQFRQLSEPECVNKSCCRYNIDLPCYKCEERGVKYAKPIGPNPFVLMLLILKEKGLPKDLARHLVKDYCVFSCSFRLTCPYEYFEKMVCHAHCLHPLRNGEARLLFFDGRGEMQISPQIK